MFLVGGVVSPCVEWSALNGEFVNIFFMGTGIGDTVGHWVYPSGVAWAFASI